jgi:hypothetical protein
VTSTTTFSSVRTNPDEDGDFVFINFAQSQRDADGDGHENSLDPCPYFPNPDWDPRSNNYPGDQDRDRLPDDCDPRPDVNAGPIGTGLIHDEDGDAYQNSQDNCPFVGNSAGIASANAKGTDNQQDEDNDGIGDACDEHPGDADADGLQTTTCLTSVISIGAGGTPSIDPDEVESLQSYSPCGTKVDPGQPSGGPTPTPGPGGNSNNGNNNGVGGPSSGIGSLSPSSTGLPTWAAALMAIGMTGVLGSLGFFALRTRRRDLT